MILYKQFNFDLMLNFNVIHGSCQTIYRRILFLNLSNTPRVQEIPFYSLCSILGMKSDRSL